jgi:dipeptidase E
VIPYALKDHAGIMANIEQYKLVGNRRAVNIDSFADPVRAVQQAQSIFVFGGNTFRLLKGIQDGNLIEAVQQRVAAGMPYVGVSAGSNVACPTMKTTNDMPIVQPKSFDAFDLVPFQINPHFVSGPTYSRRGDAYVVYAGETRETRIAEFHEENATTVIGLPEKSILRLENGHLDFMSYLPLQAHIFVKGKPVQIVSVPADLTAQLLPVSK